MSKNKHHLSMSLAVAQVDHGGNTGESMKYFYAFNQKTIILNRMNTYVTIMFSESTDKDKFKMESVLFSNGEDVLEADTKYNEKQKKKQQQSIRFKNISEKSCSVAVSILCSYQQVQGKGSTIKPIPVYFNCDPQVLNDPLPE